VAWVLLELSKMEQRYDAVVAILRDGLRVSEVAEKFGVHRDTVYVWLARYEEGECRSWHPTGQVA
jgi:transposase